MNHEFNYDIDYPNFQDKESYFVNKLNQRAKTAPPRPPNNLDDFRNSGIFNCIEKALNHLENFSHPYSQTFDMDSTDGQIYCRKFLQQLEKLQILIKTNTSSREYRKQFTNAYRILYKENELCYLTEILDSAQESVPCLYVNGDKYTFTEDVIKIGKQLFQSFLELQGVLRKGFLSNDYDSNFLDLQDFENDLKINLEKFDSLWVNYENLYVKELMIIEAQARNLITTAIKLEQDLTQLQKNENQKFFNQKCKKIQTIKKEIIRLMGQINSVANLEGKGRDDLDYNILQSAEEILENYSICESKSIRVLAQNVVNSFERFRKLLKKYSYNIEIVDPQLRNNPDLLKELTNYESFWEKGKRYFLDKQKTSQLIYFSNVIEGLCEKHKDFQDKLEYCDTEIFIMIPMIMILRKINEEDKNICNYYLPELLENNSKYNLSLNKLISIFQNIKKNNFENNKENNNSFINTSYQNFQNSKKFKTLLKARICSIKQAKIISNNLYNFFEKLIIADEKDHHNIIKNMQFEHMSNNIKEALRIMRILSIEIQRKNPVEWNEFMDIALQHTITNQLNQLQCKLHKMIFLKKLLKFLLKVVTLYFVQVLINIEDEVSFILDKIQQNNLLIFCSNKYQISRQYKKQSYDIIQLFQNIYNPNIEHIEYEYSIQNLYQQYQQDNNNIQENLADFFNCLFCIKKSNNQIDAKLKNFFLQILLQFEDIIFNDVEQNKIQFKRILYFIQNTDFSQEIKMFNFENFIENCKAFMIEIKIEKLYLNKMQQNELNCLHVILEIMKVNFQLQKYQRDLYYYEDILEKEEIYKEVLKYIVDIYNQNQIDHPLKSYGLGLMMWQGNIKFLNYSFIFTSQQKFHMIKWEKKQCEDIEKQRLQQAMFLDPYLTQHCTFELYFNIKIRRSHIVEDTFKQLKDHFSQFSIKKILKIEFQDEIGQDTGGLKREFFYQISKQIIEQKLLVNKINKYFYWFSDSQNQQDFYNFGQIFGLALLNSEVLIFNFPIVFYKYIIQENIKFQLEDLKDIDQELFQSLKNMQKQSLDESDLDYVYFDYDGNEYKIENQKINNHNKQQFIDDYVQKYLSSLIFKENLKQFKKGFYSISDFYILNIFEPQDLCIALQGQQDINIDKIKKYTKYEQWQDNDQTIIYLWEILNEFEQKEKKQFLQFLTGSTKLPLQGEESLNITIKKQQNNDYLPIAQTCSNSLFLREYQCKDQLQQHLLLCIQGDQGFYLA